MCKRKKPCCTHQVLELFPCLVNLELVMHRCLTNCDARSCILLNNDSWVWILFYYCIYKGYIWQRIVFFPSLQDPADTNAPRSEPSVCYEAQILPHTHHQRTNSPPIPTREADPPDSGKQRYPWWVSTCRSLFAFILTQCATWHKYMHTKHMCSTTARMWREHGAYSNRISSNCSSSCNGIKT